MPEDKKKFKPQNLSGLIHESSRAGSPQESRESSSPAPSTRHAGTLTSAGGTYKLSAVKDSKGDSPMWNSEKQDNASVDRTTAVSQPAKEPSPDGVKSDFNWVEEDDWNPDAISSVISSTVDKLSSSSKPWAAAKVPYARLDLGSEIEKLRTQPSSGATKTVPHGVGHIPSRGNGDGLTRFRINDDDSHHSPRDLMGATRTHSGLRRVEGSSFGGRYEQSYRDEIDDWNWNSRRPNNSMRRTTPFSARHDDFPAAGTAPTSTSLRPLKSSIVKSVPNGDKGDDQANPSSGTTDKQPDAEEKLTHQKEEMQQAKAKALEARLAKERQEEEDKKERLEARLAALDAKDNAKREEQEAERRKREAAQRQENARRALKELESARQEAEKRRNEETKEKAMEESWSARKLAGDSQPLQSMRRKEKASSKRDVTNTNPKATEMDSIKGLGHQHITIKLPELGNMDPIEFPKTVAEKFPTAFSGQHWQDSERPGAVRIVLPAL